MFTEYTEQYTGPQKSFANKKSFLSKLACLEDIFLKDTALADMNLVMIWRYQFLSKKKKLKIKIYLTFNLAFTLIVSYHGRVEEQSFNFEHVSVK